MKTIQFQPVVSQHTLFTARALAHFYVFLSVLIITLDSSLDYIMTFCPWALQLFEKKKKENVFFKKR